MWQSHCWTIIVRVNPDGEDNIFLKKSYSLVRSFDIGLFFNTRNEQTIQNDINNKMLHLYIHEVIILSYFMIKTD